MADETASVETPPEERKPTFQAPDEGETPEAEVAATEEAAVETPEEVDETPEVPDDYGEKMQKRINKAVRRQREAEEQAAYYRGRLEAVEQEREARELPGPSPKPKVEDYDDYDQYVEALSDWKVEQRKDKWIEEAEERILSKQMPDNEAQFQERMRDASERYEDFDEIVRDPAAPINTIMADVIRNSEIPGDLAYYLCTHRQEAMPLYHMRDAAKIGLALGKIEAKIQVAQEANPRPKIKSDAPAPIEPVGGGGGDIITKDPNKMSNAEYQRLRREGKI